MKQIYLVGEESVVQAADIREAVLLGLGSDKFIKNIEIVEVIGNAVVVTFERDRSSFGDYVPERETYHVCPAEFVDGVLTAL